MEWQREALPHFNGFPQEDLGTSHAHGRIGFREEAAQKVGGDHST